MAKLIDRIADFLDGESDVNQDLNIYAVTFRNKQVATPHFSYGIWPPTRLNVNNLDARFLSSHLDIRLPSTGNELTYKTASWLYLDKGFLPKGSLKRKISKSNKWGFSVEKGSIEMLEEFWYCYAKHVHRLGSLPLPKRFFNGLLSGFEEGFAEIFILRQKEEVVGAACNLYFEGFYENVWFATLHASQLQGSSYFLHNQMIKRAIELNAGVYSFGRSTSGSGVHRFKKQWNTVDVPLVWLKGGVPYSGNYSLKRVSFIIKYLPFKFVIILGDKLSRYIY